MTRQQRRRLEQSMERVAGQMKRFAAGWEFDLAGKPEPVSLVDPT